MPEAVKALGVPVDFAREMVAAGYRNPQIEQVTYDYALDVAALSDPDNLFGMSPDWTSLTDREKAVVLVEVHTMAEGRDILPVPSTALIAVAEG